MEEKRCSGCKYYLQHYTFDRNKISRIYCGHCTMNRVRKKTPVAKACDRYVPGATPEDAGSGRKQPKTVAMMDLPIDTMPLPARVRNALRKSGCKVVGDVAGLDFDAIQKMPNLGKKGIGEVLQVLRSYGLMHTAWELF